MKVSTNVTAAMVLWIVSSLAGIVILTAYDPEAVPTWLLGILYAVAFVWIFTVAELLGYFLRNVLWRSGVKYELWRSSRRQAVLFGFFAVILLLLKRGGVFNPLTAVLLLVIFVLMELYSAQ